MTLPQLRERAERAIDAAHATGRWVDGGPWDDARREAWDGWVYLSQSLGPSLIAALCRVVEAHRAVVAAECAGAYEAAFELQVEVEKADAALDALLKGDDDDQ